MINHIKNRALSRYGLSLTRGDIKELTNRIRYGFNVSRKGGCIFKVKGFKDRDMLVVYRSGKIKTLLHPMTRQTRNITLR